MILEARMSGLSRKAEMSEGEVLAVIRKGGLVRVLDLVEQNDLDKGVADRAIDRYREESGSFWHQLKEAVFG
jgi:hypothetical protein